MKGLLRKLNKILYSTKFLELKSAPKAEGNGEWCYAHRPNADGVVVIAPVIKNKNKEEEILFLITRRPPIYSEGIGEYCIELPAGLVGDERIGETTEEALSCELLEETGMRAESFEILGDNVSSSNGLCDEVSTFAKAIITDDTIIKEPVDDGGVIVDRIRIASSKVRPWLIDMNKKGYVLSCQTLGVLYLLMS